MKEELIETDNKEPNVSEKEQMKQDVSEIEKIET